MNPTAALLLALAALGLVVAVRGTQDNVLAALSGRAGSGGAPTPAPAPGTYGGTLPATGGTLTNPGSYNQDPNRVGGALQWA